MKNFLLTSLLLTTSAFASGITVTGSLETATMVAGPAAEGIPVKVVKTTDGETYLIEGGLYQDDCTGEFDLVEVKTEETNDGYNAYMILNKKCN